jgi:2-oxoglutarate dehydrogenase E2 component (dihydrolipoamide succinyltransferase)
MGDSISEGVIVDMPVAPGDYVQVDDVVLVLETDKVSVDVRAPTAGTLVEIMGEVDDVVAVGSPLFRIDTDTDAPEIKKPAAPEEIATEIVEMATAPTPVAAAAVAVAPKATAATTAAPPKPTPPATTPEVPEQRYVFGQTLNNRGCVCLSLLRNMSHPISCRTTK